jgi:hypothetical protein
MEEPGRVVGPLYKSHGHLSGADGSDPRGGGWEVRCEHGRGSEQALVVHVTLSTRTLGSCGRSNNHSQSCDM